MSAVASPGGAIVGYADSQFPPVDASWHTRFISFADGSLGQDSTVFPRDASGFDWTAISIARGNGRAAATASDDSGLHFTTIDDHGIPTGNSANEPGNPGRHIAITSSGFSALESPFDPSGGDVPPVVLAQLDGSGHPTSTQTLLDATTNVDFYSRIVFADNSFLLWWSGGSTDDALHARHYDEAGDPLAPEVTFDSMGSIFLAIGAASNGFMIIGATGDNTPPLRLVDAPYDVNGVSTSNPTAFTELNVINAPSTAVAQAPGGDFVVAWVPDDETTDSYVYVQSVSASGNAEGEATMLDAVGASSDQNVIVVASQDGAAVFYESDSEDAVEVFGIPLRCADP